MMPLDRLFHLLSMQSGDDTNLLTDADCRSDSRPRKIWPGWNSELSQALSVRLNEVVVVVIVYAHGHRLCSNWF